MTQNADAMDEYVNDMLHRYFRKLSETGYARDTEVMRLIGIEMIQEYAGHDYRGHLDRCDMVVIERALYNLAGGCALPYPKINSKPIMNKLRLGDMSEMAGRLEDLSDYVLAYTTNAKGKQKQQDERLDKLEGFHDVDNPEYDEDDEIEYGAGRKARDRGHVEKIGCGHGCRKDSRGRHACRPEPYRPVPYNTCGCMNRRWR